MYIPLDSFRGILCHGTPDLAVLNRAARFVTKGRNIRIYRKNTYISVQQIHTLHSTASWLLNCCLFRFEFTPSGVRLLRSPPSRSLDEALYKFSKWMNDNIHVGLIRGLTLLPLFLIIYIYVVCVCVCIYIIYMYMGHWAYIYYTYICAVSKILIGVN